MWGIDVAPGRGLVADLRTWPSKVDDIEILLSQAETLSELAGAARPQLTRLGSEGRATAAAVDRAIDELIEHRSTLDVEVTRIAMVGGLFSTDRFAGFVGRQAGHDPDAERAQRLIDDIRQATSDGSAPDPEAYVSLRSIFLDASDDDRAAAVAVALAMRGLPAAAALGLGSVAEIDATFDRVRAAMVHGTSPLDTDVAVEFFPPPYVEWHRLDAIRRERGEEAVEATSGDWFFGRDMHAVARIGSELEMMGVELAAIRLVGFDDELLVIDDFGVVEPVTAAVSIAAFHGPASLDWLGSALARDFGRFDAASDLRIGEVVAGDKTAALSFFNRLGAGAAARIPKELFDDGPEHLDHVLPLFGAALASVSGDAALGFTGDELIGTDRSAAHDEYGSLNGAHPELLLRSPGFDANFLLAGALASLGLPTQGNEIGLSSYAGTGYPHVDPRTTAISAVVVHNLGASLIRSLADSGELDLLIRPGPWGTFGSETAFGELPQLSGIHLLLAQAAQDQAAAESVVDHISSNVQALRVPLPDLRVANGVSSLLTISALGFVGIDDQPRFLDAYQLVLDSGAGLDVSLAGTTLIEQHVQAQLEAGLLRVDVERVGMLVGRVEGLRYDTHLGNRTLRDQASENFNQIMGIGSGGAGLLMTATGLATSLPAAALGVAGLIFGVLGLGVAIWGPKPDSLLAWLKGEHEAKDWLAPRVTRHLLIGALNSGHVISPMGNPIELMLVDDEPGESYFQVVDGFTHELLYEGDFISGGRHGPLDLADFDDWVVHRGPYGSNTRSLSDLVEDLDDIVRFVSFPQLDSD